MTTRPETPMVWQINLNGSAVRVEDLPLAVIDRIAKAHDESWFIVVNTPLQDLAIVMDLLAAAAEHLGLPEQPAPTVRQVVDLLTLVPDTVPEQPPVGDPDPFVPTGPPTETNG